MTSCKGKGRNFYVHMLSRSDHLPKNLALSYGLSGALAEDNRERRLEECISNVTEVTWDLVQW